MKETIKVIEHNVDNDLAKSDAGFNASKFAGCGYDGYCVVRAITNYHKHFINNNTMYFRNIENTINSIKNYADMVSILDEKIIEKVKKYYLDVEHYDADSSEINAKSWKKYWLNNINKNMCDGVSHVLCYNYLLDNNYKVIIINKRMSLAELNEFSEKFGICKSYIYSISHHFSSVVLGKVFDLYNPFKCRKSGKIKIQYIAFKK